eukprot:TRINITY_DN34321_c0_g1_i1.p1 TRINITY_DN34321_c0_g1~~TRINITY_DN34321_c0_g1_i1.p1  ORF type:complete len:206 (-),score=53.05 TRINITY_DN34321_c0_g1_i1:245-862(-)
MEEWEEARERLEDAEARLRLLPSKAEWDCAVARATSIQLRVFVWMVALLVRVLREDCRRAVLSWSRGWIVCKANCLRKQSERAAREIEAATERERELRTSLATTRRRPPDPDKALDKRRPNQTKARVQESLIKDLLAKKQQPARATEGVVRAASPLKARLSRRGSSGSQSKGSKNTKENVEEFMQRSKMMDHYMPNKTPTNNSNK